MATESIPNVPGPGELTEQAKVDRFIFCFENDVTPPELQEIFKRETTHNIKSMLYRYGMHLGSQTPEDYYKFWNGTLAAVDDMERLTENGIPPAEAAYIVRKVIARLHDTVQDPPQS